MSWFKEPKQEYCYLPANPREGQIHVCDNTLPHRDPSTALTEEQKTFREGAPTLLQEADSIINGERQVTCYTCGEVVLNKRGHDLWHFERDEGTSYSDEETATEQRTEFTKAVSNAFSEAEELLLRKNHDYGSKNISLSPGGPLMGLRVRLHDKFARIDNLMAKGVEPENESLRDSWLDALNYCAIALLVLDGDWPES